MPLIAPPTARDCTSAPQGPARARGRPAPQSQSGGRNTRRIVYAYPTRSPAVEQAAAEFSGRYGGRTARPPVRSQLADPRLPGRRPAALTEATATSKRRAAIALTTWNGVVLAKPAARCRRPLRENVRTVPAMRCRTQSAAGNWRLMCDELSGPDIKYPGMPCRRAWTGFTRSRSWRMEWSVPGCRGRHPPPRVRSADRLLRARAA